MSFVKRRSKVDQEHEELNLTPFLDVMITLIPFLMLTASFFTVVVIEAKLPTPISQPQMQDVPVPPPFDLVVQVPKDTIKIFLNNKDPMGPPQFSVVATDRKDSSSFTPQQLEEYYKILVNIKKQFPTETRLALDPHPALPLEKVAQILDRSRNFRNGDSALANPAFQDHKLFPGIALKGVYVP